MAIHIKGNSFDLMNQAADGITDCINSSVQDITQEAKVNEHSSIDEGNLSNIQDSKQELRKDICIIPKMVENDIGFLIPKKFF